MALKNIQTITLSGYKAYVEGKQYLVLGTWDSYGIEQLQIVPGMDRPGYQGGVCDCSRDHAGGRTG